MQHSHRFGWASTLKFQIVSMAVVTGVLSAVLTTQLVLRTTQSSIQHMLLTNGTSDVERNAGFLSRKINVLQEALKLMSLRIGPEQWESREAMGKFLLTDPVLNVMFENVLVAQTDGALIARMGKGTLAADFSNIADRDYFQQALATQQSLLSAPLVGRVTHKPVVVMSIAVRDADGRATGVVAGVLSLQSSQLFSNITDAHREDGTLTIVMNRDGVLLAHPNPQRILGQALDEPGLRAIHLRWREKGSPVNITGNSRLSDGFLVSIAGIVGSDWALVRITPEETAMEPVAAAQNTAWKAAAGVGLLSALLAGALAWFLTRPISRLRDRAEKMLADSVSAGEGWPQHGGEVGELAHAFQQVVALRQQKQSETQALLAQLEAVLDHADAGIALTRNGHFALVSRQFCNILGLEKQDILGQPSHQMYPSQEAYLALSERAKPAFMRDGAFDGEVELVRANGQKFWAHMRGRSVVAGDRSQGTIWTVQDIHEARAYREGLLWTSNHDTLTGLNNRSAFAAQLGRTLEAAATESFCAMFIDLDRFKLVNDSGGHAAGDALLRDVAQIMAGQLRQTDTVARMGGDEFAVLLPRCPIGQALELGEKLRNAVVTYRLDWEGHSFGVGASIGVVQVDGSYASSEDVLRAADAACYQAKQEGRNRVVLYRPPDTPPFS